MKEGFINALLRFKDIMHWVFQGFENLCSYVIALFVSLILPYKDMITVIWILSVVDWLFAVTNAYRSNNIQSTKMLGLVGKLSLYSIGFLLAGSCKLLIGFGFFENIITSTIFIAEAISIYANIKLVFPDVPIVRFLDNIIKSELASKTNQTIEEVEEMLNNNKKKRKCKE